MRSAALSSAELTIHIHPVDGRAAWPFFAGHHYLTSKYVGHRAWLATLDDGTPVAFTSIIAFPNGHFQNGWREHRTVVLPDFQGLGIGPRLSNWTGEYVTKVMGGRYFSRTSHPRMGEYRERSVLWRATTKNRKKRSAGEVESSHGQKLKWTGDTRTTYAHEYVGWPADSSELPRT